MYIDNGHITLYNFPEKGQHSAVFFHTNAFHVTLSDRDGNVLIKRTPDMPEWLDEKHSEVASALDQLEDALRKLYYQSL